MNDNIRKQMKDVIVPQNDIVRRKSNVPTSYEDLPYKGVERINKNPFFKKIDNNNKQQKNQSHNHSSLLWAFLVVSLLVSSLAVADYFSSTTVGVAPVTHTFHVNHDFIATKEQAGVEFAFKFISLSEEKSKEVPATIEKKIQKKASGKVLIYNYYNGEKQRLIKNTRLESPDHKIFRIDESVVVPGTTVVGGRTVPGSVEALIYADVPGKEYNIGLADFTIPGFKGDPRYTKFSAKSKPDSPLAGGFSGTVKVPSDQAISVAQEELKEDLKKIAVEKVRARIPEGVTFFPGSIVIKFEEVPQEFTETDTAEVSMLAVGSVFFFDTAILTEKLAQLLPTDIRDNTFAITNISSLTFSFIEPVDNVVLSDLLKISFHIEGDAQFVGEIDEQKIRAALIGKAKNDFGSIIGTQDNIHKADAVFFPPWKTVFPTDPARITINILEE